MAAAGSASSISSCLMEEMGRRVMPGPFLSTVLLGGAAIAEAGSPAQRREWLPRIAAGEAKAALAWTEPALRWDAAGIALPARETGGGFTLSGTKLFVGDAHLADILVVAARTRDGSTMEDGVSLFLVPKDTPGLTVTADADDRRDPQAVRGPARQCRVAGRGRCSAKSIGGWAPLSRVVARATVALCAEMCGGAQQVLDMTVDYAKLRVAFGKPIGSYQGVKHQAADMLVAIENAKSLTYYAAWAVDEGEADAPLAVAMAKAAASDMARKVAGAGIQLHGGIGMTWEHDLQLYFKRAKASEVAFGDATWHRERVARLLNPEQRRRRAEPRHARHNNFDALRLVAAVSVMFSHAFLIADGTQKNEWLIRLTGNQSILGLCGVFVFFAISGFLVTQSFEQTGDPLRFLAKRGVAHFPRPVCRRPAVGVCAGAVVTTLEPGAYFSQPAPYRYVVGSTLLDQTVHELPGRHVRQQPGRARDQRLDVDPALRVHDVRHGAGAGRAAAAELAGDAGAAGARPRLPAVQPALDFLGGWGWLLAFFAVGMILYKLRATRIFDGRIAALALAGLVLSVPLRQFIPLFPLFGCYLALWLALNPSLPVIPAARFGDLSYGLYIYGWPVEEGGDLGARRPCRRGGRCSRWPCPRPRLLPFCRGIWSSARRCG